MKDLSYDPLFPSFLYSADLELDNEKLKAECLKLESTVPTVHKSNRKGWQSDLLSVNDAYPQLKNLWEQITYFGNAIANNEGANELVVDSYWVNVNRYGAMNVPHLHGATALVVVYYVNTPHPAAQLGLLRTDGAQLCEMYRNIPGKTMFHVTPIAGRAYAFPSWVTHYVSEEQSQADPRISVAFNLRVRKPL